MSQVSDVSIANQGFSAFRTELNNILGALNTSHIGSSAPASLGAGSFWVDTSGGVTAYVLKFYDGSDHITFATINTTANTVDFVGSLDGIPNTDHTANGPQTNTFASGYSSTIMDLVYMGSGGKWLEADADASGTSINMLAIALEAKTDTQAMNVALSGSFVRDDTFNWTIGVPLYVSGTLGAITATKPTGSGDIVRTVGFSVTADVIFFNPSPDYITLA